MYGFTGQGGTAVSVSVSSGGKVLYTVEATPVNCAPRPNRVLFMCTAHA